jgi:tetratricopeptide (TPR) repeat protein
MKPVELDAKTHKAVTRLCAEAEAHAEEGRLEEALLAYAQALERLPEPTNHWEAATWIYAAIGDVHFLVGSFETSERAFQEAITCPGAVGNPFLHLRLGQLALEHGDEERAGEELLRAYRTEGEEIFANDDPKYLAFLLSQLEQGDSEH